MKSKQLLIMLVGFLLCSTTLLKAQEAEKEVDHSYKPLKLSLNEDGSKYIRFIMWHQIWAQTNNMADGAGVNDVNFSIRRSRFLAFAQISPRFLILTHWGLNGLSANNMSSLGNNSNGAQLFLHDAWAEFKVMDELYIGAGLHYWKGMNRLANSSTLNFMTMDATRPFIGWHSLGYTDQFARHMGIYAKGQIGKFDYRLAVNDPLVNGVWDGKHATEDGQTLYNSAWLKANEEDVAPGKVIEGYARYQFWDAESTKLPYAVGTYMGKKKVLGVGAGFFAQQNGTSTASITKDSVGNITNRTYTTNNIAHLSADVFMELPTSSGALNAYATVMAFNYGDDNYANLWGGTGTALYGQLGYYFKSAKVMPYVAAQYRSFKKYQNDNNDETGDGTSLNLGVNYFLNGHNAKLTLEYHNITNRAVNGSSDVSQIRLQAHVFL
jgi:hypothetical protein